MDCNFEMKVLLTACSFPPLSNADAREVLHQGRGRVELWNVHIPAPIPGPEAESDFSDTEEVQCRGQGHKSIGAVQPYLTSYM